VCVGGGGDLRAPVLPGLDVVGELLVDPAGVPKVDDFAVRMQQGFPGSTLSVQRFVPV